MQIQAVSNRVSNFLALVYVAMSLGACTADSPDSLIESGKTAMAKRDFQAAVIQFKSALQKQPQSGEVHYLLGRALTELGDGGGAVLELGKASDESYDPNRVVPALAQAMLLTGDYQKLTNLYGEQKLQDSLATAALKSSLATAWGALGDLAKTESSIRAALEAVPDFAPAKLLQARVTAGKGDLAQASSQVDQILAKDPSLYEAWLLKGEILQVNKDVRGAEAAFRKSLELRPNYLPAHMALISRLLFAGDLSGAKAQVSKLNSVAPGNAAAVYAQAQLAYAEGDMVKAREFAQLVLRAAPESVNALLLTGAIEARGGSAVVAETLFSRALQLKPEFYEARLNLAQVYLRLGQAAKAIETLKPLLGSSADLAMAHALTAEANLRLGNAAAAEADFKQAAAMDPANERFATAAALVHLAGANPTDGMSQLQALANRSKDLFADFALVSAHLRRGENDAALAAVDRMRDKKPDDASIYEVRGRVLLARHDPQGARAAFEQALKLDPKLYAATANLAALDAREGRPEVARGRFEASIQSDPTNYYARMALAALQKRSGASVEDVVATLDAAVKASPNAAEPRRMLIDLMLRERRYKEALALSREATSVLPNDTALLDAAGLAESRSGNVEQATSTFRRLASLLPKSATPWLRLADLYKSTGRREAAETALKQALELEPQNAAAQQQLLDLFLSRQGGREAIEFGQARQRGHPAEASGYLFEGAARVRLKDADSAIAALQKGIKAVRDGGGMARALYLVLLNAGRVPDAATFADRWMKDHPQDFAFEYQVAVSEIERGRFAQAEQRLRRIVEALPDNVLALNNLAWALVQQRRPGAVAFAQRAAEGMPENPSIQDTLAAALAAEKQYPKAIEAMRRGIQLAPSNYGLRLNLARIAIQAGEKDLARKELETLKSLGTIFAEQSEVSRLLASL
jgi:putative PEP-CTERM system TPR-repeat lipoprotein